MGLIQKLPEELIQKIAAGEVIQSPWNVVKELIENSIDAKATQITVILRDGGFKGIQIIDNGTGIQSDDLPLLCQRYSTSKISNFGDLMQLKSFGFRGEALASVSQVSRVSVLTRTAESEFSLKADFLNGSMVSNARPQAGNFGTTIWIEDLFYNLPNRTKSSTKACNDEYVRILDMIQRYSLRYFSIQFICKKADSKVFDLKTVVSPCSKDVILQIYGVSVTNFLKDLELDLTADYHCKITGLISSISYRGKKKIFILFVNGRLVDNSRMRRALDNIYNALQLKGTSPFVYMDFKVDSRRLDVNLHPSKMEVLFEDEVEITEILCEKISRALRSNERSIIESLSSSTTKEGERNNFPVDIVSPSGKVNVEKDSSLAFDEKNNQDKPKKKQKYDYQLIRSNHRDRSLDAYIAPGTKRILQLGEAKNRTTSSISPPAAHSINLPKSSVSIGGGSNNSRVAVNVSNVAGDDIKIQPLDVFEPETRRIVHSASPTKLELPQKDCHPVSVNGEIPELTELDTISRGCEDKENESKMETRVSTLDSAIQVNCKKSDRVFVDVQLTSVHCLIESVVKAKDEELDSILKGVIFIGFVDDNWMLIQYKTKMYLMSYPDLSEQLFYQLTLRLFANFGYIYIKKPIFIIDAVLETIENLGSEELSHLLDGYRWNESFDSPCACANIVLTHFQSKAELLNEYFQIEIGSVGTIDTLPLLMHGWVPNLSFIGVFLMRLTFITNWKDEMKCFSDICENIAKFYRMTPPLLEGDNQSIFSSDESVSAFRWRVEHSLLPLLKSSLFIAQKSSPSDSGLLYSEIADLHQLYKVFERC